MIRVIRLTGESYDLETGSALPKALVLSNGVREFSLHVDDATAMAVVEMMVEESNQKQAPTKKLQEVKKVKAPSNGSHKHVPEMELEVHRQTFGPEEPPQQQMISIVDGYEDEPYEDSYEPGEEYNDPMSGVGSL